MIISPLLTRSLTYSAAAIACIFWLWASSSVASVLHQIAKTNNSSIEFGSVSIVAIYALVVWSIMVSWAVLFISDASWKSLTVSTFYVCVLANLVLFVTLAFDRALHSSKILSVGLLVIETVIAFQIVNLNLKGSLTKVDAKAAFTLAYAMTWLAIGKALFICVGKVVMV